MEKSLKEMIYYLSQGNNSSPHSGQFIPGKNIPIIKPQLEQIEIMSSIKLQ